MIPRPYNPSPLRDSTSARLNSLITKVNNPGVGQAVSYAEPSDRWFGVIKAAWVGVTGLYTVQRVDSDVQASIDAHADKGIDSDRTAPVDRFVERESDDSLYTVTCLPDIKAGKNSLETGDHILVLETHEPGVTQPRYVTYGLPGGAREIKSVYWALTSDKWQDGVPHPKVAANRVSGEVPNVVIAVLAADTSEEEGEDLYVENAELVFKEVFNGVSSWESTIEGFVIRMFYYDVEPQKWVVTLDGDIILEYELEEEDFEDLALSFDGKTFVPVGIGQNQTPITVKRGTEIEILLPRTSNAGDPNVQAKRLIPYAQTDDGKFVCVASYMDDKIGTIKMSDDSIPPEGWAVCDGTLGTPDLRGRFIVATSDIGDDDEENDHELGPYVVGDTGGFKRHNKGGVAGAGANGHDAHNLSHSHTFAANTEVEIDASLTDANAEANQQGEVNTSANGNHDHSGQNGEPGALNAGEHGHTTDEHLGHNHPIQAAGEHDHGGATASDGQHGHTLTWNQDPLGGEHIHDNFDVDAQGQHVHTASGSGTGMLEGEGDAMDEAGQHSHTITMDPEAADGVHDHDGDVTVDADGAHTHAISDDGSHQHQSDNGGAHAHAVLAAGDHAHEIRDSGTHDHTVVIGNHTHTVSGTVGGSVSLDNVTTEQGLNDEGGYGHTETDNRPPYYALIFIKRVA